MEYILLFPDEALRLGRTLEWAHFWAHRRNGT